MPDDFDIHSSTGFFVAAFVVQHGTTATTLLSTEDIRKLDGAGGGGIGGNVSAEATLVEDEIVVGDADAKAVKTTGVSIDGIKRHAKLWHLKDPISTDDFILCKLPDGATILRVDHRTLGGTSAVFNIEIRDEATPQTTGTNIWSPDKTANSTHSVETSFNNDAVAQYEILVVDLGTITGSVTDLWIGLVYEIN